MKTKINNKLSNIDRFRLDKLFEEGIREAQAQMAPKLAKKYGLRGLIWGYVFGAGSVGLVWVYFAFLCS